jgi:hypothetical protein
MCVAGFNLSDFNLSVSVSVSEYFRFSIFRFFSIFQFVNGTSITIMIFHDACFKTSRRSTSSLKYLVQVDLLR